MNKVKQKNNKVNHSKLSNLCSNGMTGSKITLRIPPELTKKVLQMILTKFGFLK